jgi:hypothetical protein
MNIHDFPNPKLKLPQPLRDSKKHADIASFQAVDEYLHLVKDYIYTDINLEHLQTDPLHTHAYVQKVMSVGLLRSLYIRNGLVDSINTRNPVGMYLYLKALAEVVGLLASILEILESNLSQEERVEKLKRYVLGSKYKKDPAGGEVERVEAVNVLTMLEKADKYLDKISKEDKNNFFDFFYDIASNPTHPSFDAHEIFGHLSKEGMFWNAKTIDEIRHVIIDQLPGYGGLLMSPLFIRSICEKIVDLEKDHFQMLQSKLYFSH